MTAVARHRIPVLGAVGAWFGAVRSTLPSASAAAHVPGTIVTWETTHAGRRAARTSPSTPRT